MHFSLLVYTLQTTIAALDKRKDRSTLTYRRLLPCSIHLTLQLVWPIANQYDFLNLIGLKKKRLQVVKNKNLYRRTFFRMRKDEKKDDRSDQRVGSRSRGAHFATAILVLTFCGDRHLSEDNRFLSQRA